MRALQFLLDCAFIAVMVGATVSVGVAILHRIARRWTERLAPSRRADLFLAASVLPATAAISLTVAAAGPSVLALFGLHPDHCETHLHHTHLCLLHAFDIPFSRTWLGVAALGLLAFHTIHLLLASVSSRGRLKALEALGTTTNSGRFPVVRLPGEPRLCHAVGLRRRRVLLSQSLANAISKEELAAALAHEEAHHERFDGLAAFLIRGSAIFHLPRLMRALVIDHRIAMEEAADSRAANRVGSPHLVAEAIVSIARIQVIEPSFQNGITGSDIEQRVRRLLDGAEDRPSLGLSGVGGACFLTFGLILFGADRVHHAVESLLHLI